MQARDRQLVFRRPLDTVFQLLVPNAMLRLSAARVDLLTMPVTETRIDSQRDTRQRARALLAYRLTVLVDHIRRAAIHVKIMFHNKLERLAIEDVSRVHHLRRMLRLPRFKTGLHRPNG